MLTLPELGSAATATAAFVVCDATVSTPVYLQALERGADIVLHSATKFLTGQHDALLGATVARGEHAERLKLMRGERRHHRVARRGELRCSAVSRRSRRGCGGTRRPRPSSPGGSRRTPRSSACATRASAA